MERLELSRGRDKQGLAWFLVLAMVLVYVLLPDSGSSPAESTDKRATSADDAADDRERLEILNVSPNDPYAGGTLTVTHSPARGPIEVLAGKLPLKILDQHGERVFVALPQDLPLGDAKIRVASKHAEEWRSKPYHVRVRAPSYRKLFRTLVGGVALVVLGIFFLSRGVRAATSLHAARLLSFASKRSGVLLALGALLGGLAQTTTGAVGLLSGLVSSRVMGVAPAAIACLSVPLGAALAPLLVTGLVEPREGLLIVAMGVAWLLLGNGRRVEALASLLLGTGLVAYGMQVFRPALEPFLADATVWSLLQDLRAESARDVLVCAGLGALAVSVMHGPGPLVVLLLSVAQATHHGDLRTLLALLAGTGAGAGLAGLITVPAGPAASRLAKLHLVLGLCGSLLSVLTIDVWVFAGERALGRLDVAMHWTQRAAISQLGLSLFISFFLSQAFSALVLSLLAPRLSALAGKLFERPAAPELSEGRSLEPLRTALDRVLSTHGDVLDKVYALAQSGERRRGQEAEQALLAARREMDSLLGGPLREASGRAALGGVAFSVLQLQNALDHLLARTERLIDAQIASASRDRKDADESRHNAGMLESLHQLLRESLGAARSSLNQGRPLDLDAARGREIQMNRIEASARAQLLDQESQLETSEGQLSLLQVVDAYEASGNQLYRLAEQLGDEQAFIRFGMAHS